MFIIDNELCSYLCVSKGFFLIRSDIQHLLIKTGGNVGGHSALDAVEVFCRPKFHGAHIHNVGNVMLIAGGRTTATGIIHSHAADHQARKHRFHRVRFPIQQSFCPLYTLPQGIADKLLPSSVPGVDCAVCYGFGDANAVTFGFLAGLAGSLQVAVYASAMPNMAQGGEMDVIAACVIGGVSMSGGRGSVIGALLGALIMAMIPKALPLLHIDALWQNMIKGVMILAVVVINVILQRIADRNALARREM